MAPKRKQRVPRAEGPYAQQREEQEVYLWNGRSGTNVTRERFKIFSKVSFKPTLMVDFEVLKKLGIEENILSWLNNLSWLEITRMPNENFHNLSVEFLSNFHLFKDADRYYKMDFQLFGQRFEMSKEQFDECFGFYTDGHVDYTEEFEKEGRDDIWMRMSKNPRFVSGSAASKIERLDYFVMHQICSHIVLPRGDATEKVTVKDMFFMWCMHDPSRRVNTGRWLQDQFSGYVQAGRGAIVLGAHIARIARFLNAVPPPPLQPCILGKCMNLDYFLRSNTIREGNEGQWLYIKGSFDPRKQGVPLKEAKRARRVFDEEEEEDPATQTAQPSQETAIPSIESHYATKDDLRAMEGRILAQFEALNMHVQHQIFDQHAILEGRGFSCPWAASRAPPPPPFDDQGAESSRGKAVQQDEEDLD